MKTPYIGSKLKFMNACSYNLNRGKAVNFNDKMLNVTDSQNWWPVTYFKFIAPTQTVPI